MQSDGIGNTQIRWPGWIGYAVTIVLEAVLTLVLVLVEPHFPLGQFPIAYVVAIMMVATKHGACRMRGLKISATCAAITAEAASRRRRPPVEIK